MALPTGLHSLGPGDGTLSVSTGRSGAAAQAGHDLLIHVTDWQATLELAEDPGRSRVTLDADAASFRVQEGMGGMKALDDDDKDSIRKSIDDNVLRRQGISFRSSEVRQSGNGGRLSIQGDLTLAGQTRPTGFDLIVGDDGKLSATAVVKQSDWGIKPHSALFGALKVADEVRVALDARLPVDVTPVAGSHRGPAAQSR
jgi:polyisoprenoid-binding protein YceI